MDLRMPGMDGLAAIKELAPSVATRLMSRFSAPGAGPLSHREMEVLELVAAGKTRPAVT